MPLNTTAALVTEAVAARRGVGAYNAIGIEHAAAIAAGAEAAGRPAIIQISENAVRFHGGQLAPLARACAALAGASSADLALHLDHIQSPELLRQAADHCISSVMVDGSTLPWEDNIKLTLDACHWAHSRGLWVEAELGEVGGKDGAHAPTARTDPDEAERFVSTTGVDALAVAVGSSHAMTDRTAALDIDLIQQLHGAVPVPLVLHGSSGVPDEMLRAAVAAGIVKVNVGTALNVAFTAQVRSRLAADSTVVDPRRYVGPARDAMAEVVAASLKTLSDDR